jgi:hypothetical protein
MNHNHHDLEREALERRANALRADLLETVSAVDQRRHEALNVGLQLRRRWLALAVVGGSALGAIAATVVVKHRMHKKHLPELRKKALKRMWEHPERVAKHDPPSIWRDFGHKLLMALFSAAIIAPAQTYVTKLIKR